MAISVTPIPKLTPFATPAITFGSEAAAGTAISTIRSDSGVIAFNTDTPDAITYGQSGAVGSENFASRIDHAHAMAANPLQDIRCAAYTDAVQALANATDVAIALNQESFDTDSMHDNTTNNTRITFTTAGTYVITSNLAYRANGNGYRKIAIRLNGSTILNQLRFDADNGTDNLKMGSTIYTFDADDYIELIGYQNSGGSLDTLPDGNYGSSIRAVKVVG
jgi:hypothetical protein